MTDENKDQVVTEETTATAEAPAAEEVKTEEAAAPAAEAPAADEPVEVPAEYKEMIEKIENMTVLELNGLVKAIEARFGVSASAVAVAGPAAGGDAAEEKSDFDVVLAAIGGQKIAVIKVAKEVLGLGLKEAKELVEGAPASLKSGVKKEEAEEWKTKFEEAGATIELK